MSLIATDKNPPLTGSVVRASNILESWSANPAAIPAHDETFWSDLNAGIMRSPDPDKHLALVRMIVAQRDPAARMEGFGPMFAPWYRQRKRGGRLVLVHRPGTLKSLTGLVHFTNRSFASKMARQIGATHMLVTKIDIDDIIAFGVVTAGVALSCLPEEAHSTVRIDDLTMEGSYG